MAYSPSNMNMSSGIYRWLLSVSISLAISSILYSGVSLIDEYYRLRLAASDYPRLFVFFAFPIILPLIHWLLLKRLSGWAALLITGIFLTLAGGLVFLLAWGANVHHVSMGPFSGLGYVFQMASGILISSLGGLCIFTWMIAIPFRKVHARPQSADSKDLA